MPTCHCCLPVLQQGFTWDNTSSWASPPSITEFNDYSLLDLTQLPSSWLPASLCPMHLQPKTYWSSICHIFDQQLTFPSLNQEVSKIWDLDGMPSYDTHPNKEGPVASAWGPDQFYKFCQFSNFALGWIQWSKLIVIEIFGCYWPI